MRLIQIEKKANGSHRYQTIDHMPRIPDGFAVIPDDMETPNLPYGDITVEEIDGVPTVTSWTPGEIPVKSKVERDESNKAVTWSELAEAYNEGVNSIDE